MGSHPSPLSVPSVNWLQGGSVDRGSRTAPGLCTVSSQVPDWCGCLDLVPGLLALLAVEVQLVLPALGHQLLPSPAEYGPGTASRHKVPAHCGPSADSRLLGFNFPGMPRISICLLSTLCCSYTINPALH